MGLNHLSKSDFWLKLNHYKFWDSTNSLGAQIFWYNRLSVYNWLSIAIHLYMIWPIIPIYATSIIFKNQYIYFYLPFKNKKRFFFSPNEKPICQNILATTLLQNTVKFIDANNFFTDRIPNWYYFKML